MQDWMIHYELRLEGCIAEVWLNDIPLARVDGTQMAVHTRVAHGYLLSGANQIEIVAAPGATPAQARTGQSASALSPAAKAFARVVRYKVGDFTDENSGQTLLGCRLGENNVPSLNPGLPTIARGRGEVSVPFPRWAWLDAPVLALEKVQPEIVALVKKVHEAFARGQPDEVLALMAACHAETAICLPAWTADELRADLAETIRAIPASGARMRPLDEANFDLRLCAGGRLVECIGKDWQPLIQRGPDASGATFSFRMFVGKHKGRWAILRSSE